MARLTDILLGMQAIPWPSIIKGITESGLTQPDIAKLCDCGQATISDLAQGKTKDPRTSTGLVLLDLARKAGVKAASDWWQELSACKEAA